MKRLFYILVVALAVQSCTDDDPIVGGPCEYDSIPGTALIKTIFPDTFKLRMCDNAVFVYFDFVPDDSGAPDHYKFPAWPDTNRNLFVGSGQNPPASWVEAEGLAEETQHKCVRLEEIIGSCTPVIFEFSNIDYLNWPEYCEPLE